MGKNFNEEDLSKMGLTKNPDGSYSKTKTVPQPRDKTPTLTKMVQNLMKPIGEKRLLQEVNPLFRKITLKLFGEPMAKQSVLQGKNFKTGAKIFYQPQKAIDRKSDYIKQIKEQLPKDFTPFMTVVFVRKFHCVYAPLKEFHKKKGKMESIREGKKYYKNTQPDLIDNLKKLVFDCLGKDKKTGVPLVLGNDGIIVGEDNTRKYYGIGGCIIIDLEGY